MDAQQLYLRTTLLASIGALLLVSCAETPASRPVIASREAEPDSIHFQHVKYNFYRNKAGRLFEQKRYLARGEDAELGTWYDSTVVQRKDSVLFELPLSTIIDLATYQELGSSMFSKDKNRVYYFYANSGGGFRIIVNGADPATFRVSPNYQYGFDAQHGFYGAQPLRGLRPSRRQLLYGDTLAHFIAYVKDDQRVFYQDTPVPGADARTFHLVQGRAWEAEDKNYRYKCCGQRLNKVGNSSR
jgi:hypothetical protein